MARFTLTLIVLGVGLSPSSTAVAAAPAANHSFDASFNKADLNKDGFLDAAELAKTFRGPNAKEIAEKPGSREVHPDHLFIDTWDADKDGKISKSEFEKYEQKTLAALKSSANRGKTYTRSGRAGYRSPRRHGSAGRGRGYSSNPYPNLLRGQQRAYQQLRQGYSGQRRYGAYTPKARGGYRGGLSHSRPHRRR